MFSKFARSTILRKPVGVSVRHISGPYTQYGQHVFKGAVAGPYLEKQGLPANTLDCPAWTSNGEADKVCKSFISS